MFWAKEEDSLCRFLEPEYLRNHSYVTCMLLGTLINLQEKEMEFLCCFLWDMFIMNVHLLLPIPIDFLLPLFTPENLKFDIHFLKSKRSRCMNRSVLSAEQVEQVVGHLVCHANRQHHHLSAKSI